MAGIGLGTWGLGGVYYGEVSKAEGVATVRAFLDAGGCHIDTAFSYHKSEEVIGEVTLHAAFEPKRNIRSTISLPIRCTLKH